LLDCAGTASVMCSLVDDYVPDTQFETMTMMRSPVDGLWMPLAYINGGGLCLRWFRDEFGGGLSYIQLEELAGAVEAGSEGAVFIPHFSGRVLPNNPYVKGSFIGLDWKHTKGHLFKSIMEGIAYEYRFYLSVMQKLYPSSDFQKMYATGGGANSDAFNQIKSDVLGLEVVPLVMSDTALVGSAVIAGVGAKVFTDYKAPIQKSLKTRNSLHPNGVNHIAYEKYVAVYLETIEALTGVYANIK